MFSITFEDKLSYKQSQVVRNFIGSRSKLEILKIESDHRMEIFPKNSKLPIRILELNYLFHEDHCFKFIESIMSTLESVMVDDFSYETYCMLMKSSKLKKLNYGACLRMDAARVANMPSNQSIKYLKFKLFDGHPMNSTLNAFVQKFDALESLEVRCYDDATAIHSSKIKNLKLNAVSYCCICEIEFWNGLNESLPNLEILFIEESCMSFYGYDVLTMIAYQNWRLKFLKLMKSYRITVNSLKILLQRCPTLKTLVIQKCEIIGSDAQQDYEIIDSYIENGLQLYVLNENSTHKTFKIDYDLSDATLVRNFSNLFVL